MLLRRPLRLIIQINFLVIIILIIILIITLLFAFLHKIIIIFQFISYRRNLLFFHYLILHLVCLVRLLVKIILIVRGFAIPSFSEILYPIP